jgi:hypothetical protein
MRRLAAFVAVLTLAAACSDSTTTADAVNGTWNLSTLNAAALPFVLADFGGTKYELTAENIVIKGSAFKINGSLRQTTNGQVSSSIQSDSGTFVKSGDSVTFRYTSDNTIFAGSMTAGTLTINDVGDIYIFKRQ